MSISLSQIEPPALINFDRESNMADIIARIKQHPDWDSNYDGLLHHDATVMIMSIFSFLFGKNAESFDRKIRDVFLDAAYSDDAIVNNLREMYITLKQNSAAVATLQGVFQDAYIVSPFTIPNDTTISVGGLDSQETLFEIIIKDSNGDYDYFNDIDIDPGQNLTSFQVQAYAGTTFRYVHDLTEQSMENFTISVPYTPIIEGSIQVYFYLNGSYFQLEEGTLENTGKVITGIFPDGAPKYALQYSADNKPLVIFGSRTFGGSFTDAHALGSVIIYGRVGGGTVSNIPAYTMNQTIEVDIGSGNVVNIAFSNITDGSGGSDAEDIQLAKIFGPLRRGRGKQIVDRNDSLNAIQTQVVKHEIDAPLFSEEQNNDVPLLHKYHYIVPIRDFISFVYPDVKSDDTLTTYSQTLTDDLTEFLNVVGTHGSKVVEEEINNFVYVGDAYSFYKILNNIHIYSDTLIAKAYNFDDEVIDIVEFEGNYPINQIIYNSSENESAIVKSEAFTEVDIVVSSDPTERPNNNFIIKFDDHEYDFDITFAAGEYTVEILAQAIQAKIKQLITLHFDPAILGYTHELWTVKNTHIFSEYDSTNGVVILTSPKYGKDSKIVITGDSGTAAANLCEDLGIIPQTYRPDRTKLVFKAENSFFKYTNSEMFFDIVTEDMDHTEEITVDPIQNPADANGPVLSLELYDYSLEHLQKFQSSGNMVIEAYDDDTLVDAIVFKNINPNLDEKYGSQNENSTGDVFSNAYESVLKFTDSQIALQLKPPVSQDQYIQSFDPITKIDIVREDIGPVEVPITSFLAQTSWEQISNQQQGPIIYLYPLELEVGKTYLAKIYINDGGGEVLGDTVRFTNIQSYQTNGYGEVSAPDNIITEDGGRLCIYDVYLDKMTLNCKDGEVDVGGDDVYFADFVDFDTVEVSFKRKNYSYITVNYTPDPYHTEKEAAEYMDILNRKDQRLIALENQMKDINFIPIGIKIDLSVKNTHSATTARNAAYNVIMENFKYENYNPYHILDKIIDQSDITRHIMPLANDYGIINATLVSGSIKYFGTVESDKKGYYFFLDDEVLSLLLTLETDYALLSGLVDNFKIDINTVIVES